VTGPEDRTRITSLFDIRLVVGGLLVVYGVILTVQGLLDSSSAIAKAAGIRINLWTGLGMLVVGLLFLLWRRLAPLAPPSPDELEPDLMSGRPAETSGKAGPAG
jgi:xanthine/uracil/vitamin C permease (AzgA family)